MAGEFDPAIQRLVKEIERDEAALREKKRMVNHLCKYGNKAPLFADSELSDSGSVSSVRPDQFYSQPLATAIRTYLEMRQTSGLGAATVREIFDTLKAGGFKFEARDDDNAQRGLRQSLTKNSVTFHRLPNGTYGLVEWYPRAKSPKAEPKIEVADDEEPSATSGQSSDAPTAEKEDGVSEP